MFRGAHELTIDPKGRLAVPAKFREVLSRDFAAGNADVARMVVTLDSRERLLFYPECEWEKVEQQLLRLNVKGKPNLQLYQNLLLHNAETLEVDNAGRVLLPVNLRRLVDFDKDVMLVGRVNRLELWGREQKLAETEKALSIDADELDFDLSQTDLQL
ncbi:MAG: division/cell wall cluster transcriptional repressor MraZ [Alysiella sp.]|uniref:division/cell wall cluster transcriptional repressor MraZ n=1 Tax=Alysiella sp. TaxID=1872483 RepID=UPI0026DCCD48|nr:division/cell wall cluster transcriptional repressor MraZ [Alysiella sp.]MDO4434564.1 division/cell wall cluster transcriptional repressor MraZ [Alysiella sp.]